MYAVLKSLYMFVVRILKVCFVLVYIHQPQFYYMYVPIQSGGETWCILYV